MLNARRKIRKRVALFVTGATLLGIGSCLNLNLDRMLRFGAFVAATEFVLDNDAVFDLFPDSAGGAPAG